MKKSELAFALASVLIDFLMIVLSGVLAYFIRFQSSIATVRPVVYAISFQEYFNIVIVMALSWLVLFAFAGLYSLHGKKKFVKEIPKIILGCSTGILAVILLIFFRKEELFSSRFIVLAVWILAILCVIMGRLIINGLKLLVYRLGYGVHRVVIIGNDKTTNLVITGITSTNDGLGYRLVKHFKNFGGETRAEIEGLITTRSIDDIYLASPNIDKNDALELKSMCDEHQITFKYTADLFDAQATRVEINTLNEVPIIEIKRTPLDGWGRVMKRLFDIVGSLFAIVLTSPFIILISIAIKLDSVGPIIYKNERVSKDGTFFTYKFRSMFIEYCTGVGYSDGNAEQIETQLILEKNTRVGPVYKVVDDPRRTRVGAFLERTSLDELPQFWNVLCGKMSLVGPRPHQPREVAKYEKHHKHVFSVKPGVTGLAQISGRSSLDFEDEVALDTYYIENWSIWFDLYILLKTPVSLFRRNKTIV